MKTAEELLDEHRAAEARLRAQAEVAPAASAATDPGFELHVEDVFRITGRGTVATGSVTMGSVRVGDEVRIVRGVEEKTAKVTAIEAFKRTIDSAATGDSVGLMFGGRVDVVTGDTIRR